MKQHLSICLIAIIILGLITSGCSSVLHRNEAKTPLVVFGAGSLIIPFTDLEQGFEEKFPNIDVQAQYHGSIQVMRHATELHEAIDVVATADASLVPMLMYNTLVPETSDPYADWYIIFGTNHLAIAYQDNSKYKTELDVNNWYELLSRSDVKVGLADPRFDAVGYRALMVYALSQNYYDEPTIFTDMFKGQFTFPIGIFTDNGLSVITVPEILETKNNSHIILRGASVELIALLESGDIDYAFEYESVIQQHSLDVLKLPNELNLGDEAYNDFYDTVEVVEDFQRFSSVKPVFRGEQIGYGITIPSNAPHPEEAALFIAYLLSPEGRAIMENNSQPMFDPATGVDYQNIPGELQAYCAP